MKKLFPLITFFLLIVSSVSVIFAQGESISEAVPSVTENVNRMLQQGTVEVQVGAIEANDIFLASGGWEEFEFEEAYLRIDNGVYDLYAPSSGILWGQNLMAHNDVVIQVETHVISEDDNNGYGIMCRADTEDDRDGYHFWISADGFAMIFKIVDGDFESLVEQRRVWNVRRGQTRNVLTVVCVGDYLAFYANQQLLMEAHDDEFSQGVVGFSSSSFDEQSDIHITYDNLRIWPIGADTDDSESPTSIRDLANDPEVLLPALNRMLTQGDQSVEVTALTVHETFDEENGDWLISEFRESKAVIEEGIYHFVNDGTNPDIDLVVGNNFVRHTDVVIQVTTRSLVNNIDSFAGITCRSNAESSFLTGYIFWVGSNGFYTILYGDEEGVEELTSFERSEAINLGTAENEITVVCSGNYLALYVNGQLIEDLRDSRFSRGVTALSASFLRDDGSVDMAFDDVRIWEVGQ